MSGLLDLANSLDHSNQIESLSKLPTIFRKPFSKGDHELCSIDLTEG